MKFISDTKWLPLITETYLEGIDAHNRHRLRSMGQGHSYPIDESGVLAVADVVGSSMWRAGTAALWIASVEDTASTYDLHATHDKTT
jgi:hypothetical protein